MRNFVVLIAISSILVLSNCGKLKVARDEPLPLDSKPVVITKKSSISDEVTSKRMFTRKPLNDKTIITSKPMFTVKNERNVRSRLKKWWKDYEQTLPEGYQGPEKKVLLKPVDDTTLITAGDNGTGDAYREPEDEKYYETVEYPNMEVYPVEGDDTPYVTYGADEQVAQSNFEYINDVSSVPGEVVEQVFFQHGSAKISNKALNSLYDLSSDIADLGGGVHISVVGHASKRVFNVQDPAVKRQINKRMSELRAEAISRQLSKMGISSRMLIVDAKGDAVPNPNPGDMSQEAANRRVDIYLY